MNSLKFSTLALLLGALVGCKPDAIQGLVAGRKEMSRQDFSGEDLRLSPIPPRTAAVCDEEAKVYELCERELLDHLPEGTDCAVSCGYASDGAGKFPKPPDVVLGRSADLRLKLLPVQGNSWDFFLRQRSDRPAPTDSPPHLYWVSILRWIGPEVIELRMGELVGSCANNSLLNVRVQKIEGEWKIIQEKMLDGFFIKS